MTCVSAPIKRCNVKAFISYSHKDNDLRKEPEIWLSQLKRDGLIDVWSDVELTLGASWDDDIRKKLKECDLGPVDGLSSVEAKWIPKSVFR